MTPTFETTLLSFRNTVKVAQGMALIMNLACTWLSIVYAL